MKGNQEPRIKIEPERIDTDGKGASMLMQAYGVKLDPWQELVLNAWLGKDADGNYTTTSAGISASRQNGKNAIIEALEFYDLVINGFRILHTAHQARTTRKAFRRLVNMFTDKKHPEIVRLVKQIRQGAGEESIELTNGGSIEFTSRSRQAARGYDGISLVVYDEAQELQDDMAEAIMATLSASKTNTRQIIYAGTPPYVGCSGEVFKRFREACILSDGQGNNKHSAWHEWGIAADSIADIDISDKRLWYEANPALGYRLTEEFTEEEFKTLSPDGFCRERLGVWFKPSEAAAKELAIDPKTWEACRSDEPKPEGKTAYGIKFTADGSEVVLAGAVISSRQTTRAARLGTERMDINDIPASRTIYAPGGIARIEVIAIAATGNGLTWLANWLNERYTTASCVVIDGKNGADLLIDKIKDVWRLKDSVIKPSAQNVVTAANLLLNDISEGNITWYSKQEELNDSALTTTKRPISGGFGFGGQTSAPIEACSLALWGVRNSKRNPQRKMLIG